MGVIIILTKYLILFILVDAAWSMANAYVERSENTTGDWLGKGFCLYSHYHNGCFAKVLPRLALHQCRSLAPTLHSTQPGIFSMYIYIKNNPCFILFSR